MTSELPEKIFAGMIACFVRRLHKKTCDEDPLNLLSLVGGLNSAFLFDTTSDLLLTSMILPPFKIVKNVKVI